MATLQQSVVLSPCKLASARPSSTSPVAACSLGQVPTPIFSSLTRTARLQFRVCDGSRGRMTKSRRTASIRCAVAIDERSYGSLVVQGTRRPSLEDTSTVAVDSNGPSFFGVFDGHGGSAVAEMLRTGLWPLYKGKLSDSNLERATTSAYLEFDKLTLVQPKGFFGALMERGVGGSRCGSTAATVVLIPSEGGKGTLVAANVGDARVVLCRGGEAVQLTFDHKPDVEGERARIESKNPTPKKPLVLNIEGIWRVGGLLNLSRAFGDAYLKETVGERGAKQGGFGLTAEPHVAVESLTPEDEFVILGTDGFWEAVPNKEAVNIVRTAGNKPLNDIVKQLTKTAQDKGSSDDIALVVVRL